MRKTIAVDFDTTITTGRFPELGEPRSSVVNLLRKLKEAGWEICIHTCRVNPGWGPEQCAAKREEMEVFLADNNIPYDSVWNNQGKPLATIYLDDRSLNPLLFHDAAFCELINIIARDGVTKR